MRPCKIFCHILAVVLAMAGLLAGSTGCGAGSGEEGGKRTLTVLAASSLTDAFGELERRFEREHPGVEVRQSFAASSVLLVQIQQGARADVFASADLEKMREAEKEGLVFGEPEVFARNRLVILVPKDNPADISGYRDLGEQGVRLVLPNKEVPAAEYAARSLEKASRVYGGDFRRRVLSNLVSREADVRAAVNRVALGDADATFAYASDVTPGIRDRVRVVEVPERFNVVATYPIAVLESSRHPRLAREWVGLVTGREGQRVLKKWGFEPARWESKEENAGSS